MGLQDISLNLVSMEKDTLWWKLRLVEADSITKFIYYFYIIKGAKWRSFNLVTLIFRDDFKMHIKYLVSSLMVSSNLIFYVSFI